MSEFNFRVNPNKPQFKESKKPKESEAEQVKKVQTRRKIEDLSSQNEPWDALDEIPAVEEKPMDMKKLKQEIKAIIKFEGTPLSRSEIKEIFETEGAAVITKQFYNAIDSMITSGELIKTKDEELGANRYRYALSEQAAAEMPDVPQSSVELPGVKLQTMSPPVAAEPITPSSIQLDPTVFDELFMVYVPDSGIAKVCEDLSEAKSRAKEMVTDVGNVANIHRIYSEPLLTCKPVTSVEFEEIL